MTLKIDLLRPTRLAAAILLGSVLVTGSCAGRSASQGRSLDVLMGEEIRQTMAPNLYYALVELRPRWLWPRGRSSIVLPDATQPVVYVYGMRRGLVDALFDININDVRRVEYISPLDATTRYGTNHAGGVIDVDLEQL